MAATDGWIRIVTTLPQPLPTSAERTPTLTSRLLIRPLAASDLDGLYQLTRNHEVMKWTAAGRAHTGHEEAKKKLDEFLPPNDAKTFNYAICLRGTGEFIGIGGIHRFSRVEDLQGAEPDPAGGYGWPELGYLLKPEYWGKGLATEFVAAFLGMWEHLQRANVEIDVNVKSLLGGGDRDDGDGDASVPATEALIAIVDPTNGASQRILQKCGFSEFDNFAEQHHEDPDKSVQLLSFRYFPNAQKPNKELYTDSWK